MYKVQKSPDTTATMVNGSEVTPVLTLKSEHGSVAHIIIDDHCYVMVIDNGTRSGRVIMSPHWFPELFEAARTLPALKAA